MLITFKFGDINLSIKVAKWINYCRLEFSLKSWSLIEYWRSRFWNRLNLSSWNWSTRKVNTTNNNKCYIEYIRYQSANLFCLANRCLISTCFVCCVSIWFTTTIKSKVVYSFKSEASKEPFKGAESQEKNRNPLGHQIAESMESFHIV